MTPDDAMSEADWDAWFAERKRVKKARRDSTSSGRERTQQPPECGTPAKAAGGCGCSDCTDLRAAATTRRPDLRVVHTDKGES